MNNLILEIASISVLAFAAFLFALQAMAREIGYFIGRGTGRRAEIPQDGVGVVVGGMLGLLAFVLAITLSFASTRFQERRDGTLAEANAIGTAWLRAHAIGHPRGGEIAALLEDYTRLRMEFVRADFAAPELQSIESRAGELQAAMWGHAAAIVRERPDAAATSLLASLNETFDLGTAERFAFATTLPPPMFWLLIGMSTLSMAALGFQLGLRQTPLRMLSLVLLCMWTATMTVILDLGSARLGMIRIDSTVYQWTLDSFRGGLVIPPAR